MTAVTAPLPTSVPVLVQPYGRVTLEILQAEGALYGLHVGQCPGGQVSLYGAPVVINAAVRAIYRARGQF